MTAAPSESVLLRTGASLQLRKAPPRDHVGTFPGSDDCSPQSPCGSGGWDAAKYSSRVSLLVSVRFLSRVWWVLSWGVFIPGVW